MSAQCQGIVGIRSTCSAMIKMIDGRSRRYWRAPLSPPEAPARFAVLERMPGRCAVLSIDGATVYVCVKRHGPALWARALRDGLDLGSDPPPSPWCIVDAPGGLDHAIGARASSAAAAWIAQKDA